MSDLAFHRDLTPAETELQAWAEAQPGGPSFARLHGAIHGVIASSMSSFDLRRSPLVMLHAEAPPEVHALAVRAVSEVHALVPEREVTDDEAALVTVPDLSDHGVFLEWVAGLGAAALAKPEVLTGALAMRGELERSPSLGRGKRAEVESLREMVDDLLFLLVMSPPEVAGAALREGAELVLGPMREQWVAESADWSEDERRETVLSCLTAVHGGYETQAWLERYEERDAVTVRREGRKIRPNEPCPCGSGRKFKRCHGAPGAPPLTEG